MGEYHWKSKNIKSCGVDDMVLLPKIEVAAISENLQKRLNEDMIYTYIGAVLIAVNPFKALPYFTDREIDLYQNCTPYENPPHVFALCDSAYRNMLGESESQCVIISGESGAGKTVSAKYVMNYITKVSGGGDNVQRVKDIIIQSNPLLEAFGNAKTLRNDNSSRFGKYVEILFKSGGIPQGGRISNFLLEKSRVCFQNKGERNFHIFYQILSGLDNNKKRELSLGSPEDYLYLSQSECFTVNEMDDAKEFQDVKNSMKTVGLPNDVQEAIVNILAGILHLGNIGFTEEKNQAVPKDRKMLNTPAKLLGVSADGLLNVIITRNIEGKWGNKSEIVKMEHNEEQAVFTLGAIAKAIYSRIFTYLVEAINTAIDRKDCEKSIGILDIYGFEIFQKNGFEQFCINYVNEKLQQIFIELTLKVEQEEYVAEAINWTPISYFNNKVVCDLIESTKAPVGIISVMDDVCATMHAKGGGADQKLITDLSSTMGTHQHFFISGQGFIIQHYAGKVTYDVEGFCEKNRDVLFNDPIELMKNSTCKFLASLFPEDISSDKKGRPTTSGSKIRTQANALVEKLMKCVPHYIRCIKPNESKKPYDFDASRVKHQIEYQGLKENIRIKRAGFAYRRPFGKFLERFAILTPETYPTWRGGDQDGIKHIMDSVGLEQKEWQLGKTKIFIKTPESLFLIEELRDRKFDGYARVIQKQWRTAHNQNVYDKEKMEAAQLMCNKKQRYFGSINRKFFGNYFNFEDQPILLTLIEKKENVSFSVVVQKYDRKFRAVSRDLLVTQKNVYLIGRDKVKKGPQKGKIIDVVKRKIPHDQIKELQLSTFQDDFVVIHVKDDYSTLIETPLKTEFLHNINKHVKKATQQNVPIKFSETLDVFVKKEGLRLTSHLTVCYVENPQMVNNLRQLKASMTKLTVTIRPGSPANSMPKSGLGSSNSINRGPGKSEGVSQMARRNPSIKQNQNQPQKQAPPAPAAKKLPPKPPPSKKKQCKALWDYDATNDGELSFKADAIIDIVTEDDSGWWKGSLDGNVGLFPYNYVEKI